MRARNKVLVGGEILRGEDMFRRLVRNFSRQKTTEAKGLFVHSLHCLRQCMDMMGPYSFKVWL